MTRKQLVKYLQEQIRSTIKEGLEGRVMNHDYKKGRSEKEALELERQGYMRIDKRKPSFNYEDQKGSYIPMVKKIAENNTQSFSNWVMPSEDKLRLEFRVEQELKRRNFFKDYEDFRQKIEQAEVVEVTPEMDSRIGYRSNTQSKEELIDLISTYASYPEFRNEKTVENIYTGFKNNKPMDYPVVLKFSDGRMRVFSGNTRMDVAFQLGINPKVLLVDTV